MINRDMKKKDLAEMTNISFYKINKLNCGDNVNTDTLAKICRALGCTFDDIRGLFPEKSLMSVLLDSSFDKVKVENYQD